MVVFTRLAIISSWLLWTRTLCAPVIHPKPPTTSTLPSRSTASPLSTHQSGGEEHVVIFNKNTPQPARVAEVLQRLDLDEKHPDVRRVFDNSAFRGFSASMKSHCLDLLANMSDISVVEKAATVRRGSTVQFDERANAPWGLQRISTSSVSMSGRPDAMTYTYSFPDNHLGSGADVYIIDTGIYANHNVFHGRARMIWSFNGDMSDPDGHGTHVAGTAAGDVIGVASKANVYGIKALDREGSGWDSDVIQGIDYAIRSHDRRKASGSLVGSVISMSLASAGGVSAINSAVRAATEAGVHVVVAAGNEHADACATSPASAGGRHGHAITVGAVDISTQPAPFSNYGDCVDVYAPGVDVVSSWIGAPNMVNVLSGTSMATPHVAGMVAAAITANRTLATNPPLMKQWIRMTALVMSDGSLLANNGVKSGPRVS